MYTLISEASFDSAHFLLGHDGKCKNIHGHRWTVKIEILGKELQADGSSRDMILDFSELKKELKSITDYFDHSLIIEENSLKKETLEALKLDNFRIIEISFRPTAEKFAKYFFDYFSEKGFPVKKAIVFETPNNCATYERD